MPEPSDVPSYFFGLNSQASYERFEMLWGKRALVHLHDPAIRPVRCTRRLGSVLLLQYLLGL